MSWGRQHESLWLTSMLGTKTGELCQAIRLLRSPEGVDVIVTGELDEAFSGDQDAVLLKMVEGSVRRARRD